MEKIDKDEMAGEIVELVVKYASDHGVSDHVVINAMLCPFSFIIFAVCKKNNLSNPTDLCVEILEREIEQLKEKKQCLEEFFAK